MTVRPARIVPQFFLLLILLATSTSAQAGTSIWKDGVVKVEAGNRTGSGFILKIQPPQVFILTAYHVVEGVQEVRITFFREPYRPYPAKVIRHQHELGDEALSILQVEIEDPRGLISLPLSQDVEPNTEDAVHALGFYGGGSVPWSVTEARIVGVEGEAILFTGDIAEGNSGGPLLRGGEVLGVVTVKGNETHRAISARMAQHFAEGPVGVLSVQCDARSIPEKPCRQHLRIDRKTCDFIKRGNLLFQDGEYRAAVEEYSQAMAYQPNLAVLYNNRAVIKLTERDFEGANDDFTEAKRLDPDYQVVEVNQYLMRLYSFYFDWAESYPSGDQSESLLDLLKGADKARPGLAPPEGETSPFAKVLRLGAAAGSAYHDYLRFESLLSDIHRGNFTCYGGDILAANQESSLVLGEELARYLERLGVEQGFQFP